MEKKPVISLTDGLSEGNVFFLTTSLNYNDKIVLYNRGIVKTEIIDGEEFTGEEPKYPYQVIEIDKKTGKRKFYKVELEYEDDLGPDIAKWSDELYEEIDINYTGSIELFRHDEEENEHEEN